MDPMTALAALLGLVAVAAGVLWATQRARVAALQGEAARLAEELRVRDAALAAAQDHHPARVRAETERDRAEIALREARAEALEAHRLRDAAREERQAAETARRLAEQELAQVRAAMGDWEKTKEALLTSAKAAVVQTSADLSNKLLADHRLVSEQARKEGEEQVAKTTRSLFEQFEKVSSAVNALDRNVAAGGKVIEGVVRALSSPGGAGQYAEIGLENTLKSFGLEPGRDFVMQFSVWADGGAQLRPDAVVFLPGDAVMIVDSKASKFLLEIGEAEGTEREAEGYGKLARSMGLHLRSLAGKDYRNAVVEACRKAGRTAEPARAITVMCLPSDAALERLLRADPAFNRTAAQYEIIPSGPMGLHGLIGLARVQIDLGRQAENQRQIVEETTKLLDNLVTALGHVEGAGRGLKTAADAYGKLIASLNARTLPSARRLVRLGVRPGKRADMPANLGSFQVTTIKEADLIEGEATAEVPALGPAERGEG